MKTKSTKPVPTRCLRQHGLRDALQRLTMTLMLVMLTAATAWAGSKPVSCLDACTGGLGSIHIQGWAYDPDAPAKSLTLELYIYADADCQQLVAYTQNLTADVSRPDVNEAKGITGNHGFYADIPMGTAGNYWVKLIAIDTNGDGDTQIGSTTKVTVTAPLQATVTLNENSGEVTLQNGDVVTGNGGSNTRLKIAAGATVTLYGVDITAYRNYGENLWAGITCLGNATIILADGTSNYVRGGYRHYPGIQPGPNGTTLTIRGTGSLEATSYGYGAGIGSGYKMVCGNIVIENGNISAYGGRWWEENGWGGFECGEAPGIGAADSGTCGNITISGGNVYAYSAEATGIGSSDGGTCGNITITGGTVTAIASHDIYNQCSAAAIGSDQNGTCGNITIPAGKTRVTATSKSWCIIGPGGGSSTCGTVTIGGVTGIIERSAYYGTYTYAPTVYTYAVRFDANGGTGTMPNQTLRWNTEQALETCTYTREFHNFLYWNTKADGSGITYTDGQNVTNLETETLYAQWQRYGDEYNVTLNSGIGELTLNNGAVFTGTGGSNTHITIADGATVTLNNVNISSISDNNSHQWSGLTCLGNATIILKGENTINGGYQSSGIYVPNGSTLIIRGDGSLVTQGKENAAGIGGDSGHQCGNIRIEGGRIKATGGNNAPGIGSGSSLSGLGGDCNSIVITGGDIKAYGGQNAAGIGSGYQKPLDFSNPHNWPCYSSCEDITITGGKIFAIGGVNGAGIGSGYFEMVDPMYDGFYMSKCNITITNGIIEAQIIDPGPNPIGAGCMNSIGTVRISCLRDRNNGRQRKLWGLVLADGGDNTAAINSNNGITTDVQLRGRIFHKDGRWNTLCLPFPLSGEQIAASPLAGAIIKQPDGTTFSLANGTLTLNFTEVTSIEAGKPYIVKWNASADNIIESPIFENVAVDAKTPVGVISLDGNVAFIGTYEPFINPDGVMFDEYNTANGACYAGLLIDTPAQDGYSFGWYTDLSQDTPVTSIPFDADGNVTFTAKWTKNVLLLLNDDSNATAIATAAESGKVYEVTLTGRTLYKDGAWNTLCLPFDVSTTSEPLSGDNVKAMVLRTSDSGLSGTTLTLNFDNAPATIPAGTPFIIKWDGDGSSNLVSPVFTGVTISNTAPADDVISTDGNVQFLGTYGPVKLDGNNKSNLYLGAANKLYWPSSDKNINAFRAYFQLSDGVDAREFVLNFGEDENTTGVVEVENGKLKVESSAGAWYTLDGRKLDGKPTKKGLYIVNGRKVVIK